MQATANNSLGLALSGGGSRAAAFHRGTLQGLNDIGFLDRIDVVSSVSGGSIFAAAWMASLWKGQDVGAFLDNIGHELARGFIARSINWHAAKLLLPTYTRANLLAETFDRVLMRGMRLKDLPARPQLCMNASVMNTGQVGKFSRDGFSSTGIFPPGQVQSRSNPVIDLPDFSVALAATASAAFPIGLPPVYLKMGEDIPEGWGNPDIAHHSKLALTDGGVLENFGVQTLLKSKRFGAWDIIISDAGRKEDSWNPGGIKNSLRGAMMGMVSLPTIERVTVMMNNKQNRHMRLSAFGELERTWLVDALRVGTSQTGMKDYLSSHAQMPRRRILFIQLSQTLKGLLTTLPRWRLQELAARANHTLPDSLPPIRDFLEGLEVNLSQAFAIYDAMGGEERIAHLNRISTNFTALTEQDIEGLAAHARWQVHAVSALYWH